MVASEDVISPGARVVVFGGGGQSAVVFDLLVSIGAVVVAYATDGEARGALGDRAAIELALAEGFPAVVAIGDNHVRSRLLEQIGAAGIRCPLLVHPSATLAGDATIGHGTVVHHHAHVGAGARVGAGCIVNSGAIVEHHVSVGRWSHVAPGAVVAGSATIGAECLIGAGAVVLPSVVVGDGAVIAAGAVVDRRVSAAATVMGVPARPSERSSGSAP